MASVVVSGSSNSAFQYMTRLDKLCVLQNVVIDCCMVDTDSALLLVI
jgi:hypothetical protein